jgi:hypothetical protein
VVSTPFEAPEFFQGPRNNSVASLVADISLQLLKLGKHVIVCQTGTSYYMAARLVSIACLQFDNNVQARADLDDILVQVAVLGQTWNVFFNLPLHQSAYQKATDATTEVASR